MNKTPTLNVGIIYAVVTAIGLGSITTQAKIFYADGGNAITVLVFRFVCSVLVIGLFFAIRKQSVGVPAGHRKGVALIGFIWSASMISYIKSVESISVSLAVLILYTYPLIVLIVVTLRKEVPFSVSRFVLFLLVFLGMGLALFSGNVSINPIGILFAFGGAAGAAYTFLRGAALAPNMSPVVVAFWVNMAGLILIMVYLLVFKDHGLILPTNTISAFALAGATACYIVAVVAQFLALSRLSASRAAFILNLEPIVSILLAVLLLSEILGLLQWSGVILVLLALFASIKLLPAVKGSTQDK